MCLTELHPGQSLVLLAVSSFLTNQQYILKYLILNRSVHETRSYMDQLTKNVTSGSPQPNSVSLRAVAQYLLVQGSQQHYRMLTGANDYIVLYFRK